MSATFYMKLGEVPRKRHIKLSRETARSFKGEGMHYEHPFATEVAYHREHTVEWFRRHMEPYTQSVKEAAIDTLMRDYAGADGRAHPGGRPFPGRRGGVARSGG